VTDSDFYEIAQRNSLSWRNMFWMFFTLTQTGSHWTFGFICFLFFGRFEAPVILKRLLCRRHMEPIAFEIRQKSSNDATIYMPDCLL
jgi:hypothetical protein